MSQSPDSRTVLWRRIACIAGSLLALFLVTRRVEIPALVEVFRRMDFGWYLAAPVFFVLATACAALRWHLVLRSNDLAVHPAATTQIVVIGHFFNTLLFGPAGGDWAKAALYARWYQFGLAQILPACFLDRLLGGAGFLLFSALAPSLALNEGRSTRAVQFLSSSSGLWVLAGLALVVAVLAFMHYRFRALSPLQKLATAFRTQAGQFARHPGLAFRGVLFGFLGHLFMSGVFLSCLQALTQRDFSWTELLWTLPIISLISSVPITFSGVGLREGAALALLGLYGIPAADAVAASLLVFTTFLICALLSGGVFWRAQRKLAAVPRRTQPRTISVVIPALDEAAGIGETIRRAQAVPEVTEIIVVDGGSTDNTVAIAKSLGCQVLTHARGRGGQMRAGAEVAQGDVILFCHADTWLPRDAGRALLNCFRDATVVGGGFWKVFRERKLWMLGSRFRCALRLYLGGRVLGDQALFARKEALAAVGGMPDLPLMEDFELCRRLRSIGRLALAGATVVTSARRFEKWGVARTYWRMWMVTLRYYRGVDPEDLVEAYERETPAAAKKLPG